MANLDLVEAVRRGDMEAVERLLNDGADVNQQDEHGWTPLMWTAGRGDAKAASFLLERGSDVTIAGPDGRTALLIAKSAGHRQVAEVLAQAEKERGVWQDPRATCAYCKAYYLRDVRRFEGWFESSSVCAERASGGNDEGSDAGSLTDGHVVYLHQDFTVTRSMWHGEGVIFDNVTPQWRTFCEATLTFAIPEDLF